MSEVIATYLVHDTGDSLEKKAEGIALGLTIGSWTNLPKLEQNQLKKHKGIVISVEQLNTDNRVNQYLGKQVKKGIIRIAYPSVNFSADLPAILTTTFGKLSLDGEVKLLDLEFSNELKATFSGPKFGINSIRKKLGVFNRPLVMSIFKGVIGRDIEYLKDQLREQALGGVNIIKDDEILFENTLTPFETRIIEGRKVLEEVYNETGHRALYAVNVTGRTFELKDKARNAVSLGADLLLFNVFAYGIDVLQSLAEDPQVTIPIMAHPAVSGTLTPSEFYGFSNILLLGKLLRYAGADLVLFPSPYGSVALERQQTLAIAAELTKNDESMKPSFPVPSAGIHPGLVPLLINDFGTDSVINAGGGVHGHPNGAIGGGKAFHAAVDAVLGGKTLIEYAKNSPELQKAIDLWGYQEVSR